MIIPSSYSVGFTSNNKKRNKWLQAFLNYFKYPNYITNTDDPDVVKNRVGFFNDALKRSKLFNKKQKNALEQNMLLQVVAWMLGWRNSDRKNNKK